ncbi:VanZ family protein [Cryobacterium sp. Hh7]|uniref:VanZ family protein n=1 Tax=Cryobacterium sp. Hh7 TaxID=1259159 RepID=UPI001069D635|nr:VanZ family protein [Cryobacterium sp. Hh7]TFD51761.1 VanZ family protein [Cryobacterium sp. Hh7]
MRDQQPPKSRAREWIGALGLAASLIVVLGVTLSPTPLDQGYASSIDRLLSVLHRNGIPEWYGYNKLEFTTNIVMFMPLGFIFALMLSHKMWWLALLICPALSICIELTQAAVLTSRFATVSDVLANSLGALVGILMAVALRAAVYQRDQKVVARALWQELRVR